MTAAAQREMVLRPKVGDRLKVDRRVAKAGYSHDELITLADGSLLVPPEALARFGNGDAKAGRKELRLLIAAEEERKIADGPATKPENVRIAGQKDEAAILELLLLDLKENAEAVAPVDREMVVLQIRAATRRDPNGAPKGIVGVIDDKNGKPVAVVLLVPIRWWWSKAWYFQDIVNYVHPDHRATKYFQDLFQFEKWASDEMTRLFGWRVYLLTGVMGYKRIRTKIMLYKRKFMQCGAAFLYPAPRDGEGL